MPRASASASPTSPSRRAAWTANCRAGALGPRPLRSAAGENRGVRAAHPRLHQPHRRPPLSRPAERAVRAAAGADRRDANLGAALAVADRDLELGFHALGGAGRAAKRFKRRLRLSFGRNFPSHAWSKFSAMLRRRYPGAVPAPRGGLPQVSFLFQLVKLARLRRRRRGGLRDLSAGGGGALRAEGRALRRDGARTICRPPSPARSRPPPPRPRPRRRARRSRCSRREAQRKTVPWTITEIGTAQAVASVALKIAFRRDRDEGRRSPTAPR